MYEIIFLGLTTALVAASTSDPKQQENSPFCKIKALSKILVSFEKLANLKL